MDSELSILFARQQELLIEQSRKLMSLCDDMKNFAIQYSNLAIQTMNTHKQANIQEPFTPIGNPMMPEEESDDGTPDLSGGML